MLFECCFRVELGFILGVGKGWGVLVVVVDMASDVVAKVVIVVIEWIEVRGCFVVDF